MEALGVQDASKSSTENEVSLGSLAEITGFPIDYIKRELVLSDESDLSVEELRAKVLAYLSTF